MWGSLDLEHETGAAKIRADFHLFDIQQIHDEEERFEFSGVLTLTWQDERQRFDPEVEGVKEMV